MGPTPDKPTISLAQQITLNRNPTRSGRGGRARANNLRSYPAIFLDVDRTRITVRGHKPAGCGQQLFADAEVPQLHGESVVLGQPGQRLRIHVAVQAPQYKIDSMQSLDNIPISSTSSKTPQILGNMGTVSVNTEPALLSEYDNQPMMNVYASVEGRDWVASIRIFKKYYAEFQNKLPRGTQLVSPREVSTMTSSFAGLTAGVGVAILSGFTF